MPNAASIAALRDVLHPNTEIQYAMDVGCQVYVLYMTTLFKTRQFYYQAKNSMKKKSTK